MTHLLVNAHRKLRRGEFDQSLRDEIRLHCEEWRSLSEEVERLKANYVVAEVFDYFGDYQQARAAVEETGPEQVAALNSSLGKTNGQQDPTLFRRRVWLAIAYAMSFYRLDEFKECIDVLNTCDKAVDDVDPGKKDLFGTRARLAHTRARADRQLHKHDDARRGFNEAMVFAQNRFVLKTPWAEQSSLDSPPFGTTVEKRDEFEDHRLLAHWTMGRCLAPGLGYIDYTTGRLSSADTLLSAGYSLLRGTGDVIQRAFARLLMGTVARARAGSDLVSLERAINLLEDGANVLRQHATLTLRASYELALAYYKSPKRRDDAMREIKKLKAKSGDSARWMSSALVIESRVQRLNDRGAAARKVAEEAVKQATAAGSRHTEIQAEALIALGEACLSEADALDKKRREGDARQSRREAVDKFNDALNLGAGNPKIAAVCNLHLAESHVAQGAFLEAHLRRAAASPYLQAVEHGFVKELATSIDKVLERSGMHVVDGRQGSLDKEEHILKLEAFLLTQARARNNSPAVWSKLLGLKTTRGGERLLKRLRRAGHLNEGTDDDRRQPSRRRRSSSKKR